LFPRIAIPNKSIIPSRKKYLQFSTQNMQFYLQLLFNIVNNTFPQKSDCYCPLFSELISFPFNFTFILFLFNKKLSALANLWLFTNWISLICSRSLWNWLTIMGFGRANFSLRSHVVFVVVVILLLHVYIQKENLFLEPCGVLRKGVEVFANLIISISTSK